MVYTWSVVGLAKVQATSMPDESWLDVWSNISKCFQQQEKRHWLIEKPKLDKAQKLKAIYYIDPEDMEFKENARKN